MSGRWSRPSRDDIGRGGRVALISDAGTPLLSDPGFPLVRAVREAGLPVFATPGASALLAALAVAGLPTDAFSFLGFLPPKAEGAEDGAGRTEGPPRDAGVLRIARAGWATRWRRWPRSSAPDRLAVVALELTKKFERVSRGTLGELAPQFGEAEKGEAVILVAGASEVAVDPDEWRAALAEAMVDQPLRAAVDEIAARFSLKRKDVYDAALALKAEAISVQHKFAEGAGRRGEMWAELFLRAKFYRIVARRVKTPVGEIDLIVAARRASPCSSRSRRAASRIRRPTR